MIKHIPRRHTLKPFHLLALLFVLPFLVAGCGQQEASHHSMAPDLSWEYEASAKRMLDGGKTSMQLAAISKVGTSVQESGFAFPDWFGGQPKNSPVASPSAGGAGAKQYLDSLFDRIFLPEGMRYTLTDLGTLGGKEAEATAISADGSVVVGISILHDLTLRAFHWKGGVMNDLGTLGGKRSGAFAVSADGSVVVGSSELSDDIWHAFRWQDSVMTDLGTLGGKGSRANAVSADGSVVVGGSKLSDGSTRAFRWKDGVMTDLGTLGGKESRAFAVSADGSVVVGESNLSDGSTRAFRWKDGVMTDLGTLGGKESVATAISADGSVVVGGSNLSDGSARAFRWKDGVMTDLGTLGGKGVMSRANAVSADGSVVMGGTYSVSTDGSVVVGSTYSDPFSWEDGVMTDLSSLIGTRLFHNVTTVSADGSVVAGNSGVQAFIAIPPRVAGLPISTARTLYYALLAVIALGLLIAFALAVRYAVRRQRAHRPAPAGAPKIFCRQCGSAQLPAATFCTNCGARLKM